MVVINLKISEKNQFLHETTSSEFIESVLKELVLINNLRVKIDLLCQAIEDLMKFGPLRPEDVRGLKESENIEPDIEDKYKVPKIKMPERIGTRYNEDKTNMRTGWILEENTTNNILKGIEEAKEYISKKRTEEKKVTKIDELMNLLDLLKAGVMIGYPAYHGLPEWEPAIQILEDNTDILEKDEAHFEFFKLDVTTLWNAGKELMRGKILSDYIGKNEKTKIVCKFSKKGQGAPVREPLVDKETQNKMLSYYFKKQEEQKKLEVENDDSYLNSEWADSNAMKKQLYYGNRDIGWKYK